MIKLLRKNLRKRQKPTIFYLIPRENKIMIILDMLRLKMVEGAEEDLVTLIFRVAFLIFLRTSLEKVLEEGEDLGSQIIEVLI